ncbi:helix-turn-helix domain-containing protein [Gordonia sp. CPCC 206044]|uniref:helix-turn-helix domain-containing protein n=1 Tax=Gordonia sp. CPCC 206044 TaxID=3140793 RepID=UPI003AF36E4B
MADYLDVSRNTVGTWINGRIDPSVQALRLWALRTGVAYDWLRNGTTPEGGLGGGGECARRDSNPKPSDP